jgi:hypothetical protein
MRRTLAVACMAALIVGTWASVANAQLVGEVGYHRNAPAPGKPLPHQTGILAPSPSPTVLPSVAVGGGLYWLTAEQVAGYLRGAGFPESVIPTMVAIAYRESHWNAHAVNLTSGACGLLQLYPCPGLQALNPATNAALAYAKYEASGLSPWGM